jgi:glycosyltransferase involved in cell wall biosynthesis
LKQLADSLGLRDRILFPGPVRSDAMAGLAARHSFFLLLSRYEGMAMAVVEAMQFGLVPVVTPVGQIASYVDDGKNGIFVDPEDLERTADRLDKLLSDPERFVAMSKAAAVTWESHPTYAEDICRATLALEQDG